MSAIDVSQSCFLAELASKTVIITGGAGGIGAATARVFNEHGANVVVADIPASKERAEQLVANLPYPHNALFIPVDILNWKEMVHLFRETIEKFGTVDTVVANAAIMEKTETLDVETTDYDGNLLESTAAFEVIDVNLKGTLNTLRLAMHYMKSSTNPSGGKKSIVLVVSTSGYFGNTGVSGYVSTKHGVIGLLRSSQVAAKQHGISITGVAPFFTPTNITSKVTEKWRADGLEPNTPEQMGLAIAQSSAEGLSGSCTLVAGRFRKEMEFARREIMPQWLGRDLVEFFQHAFKVITSSGGYNLPMNTSAQRRSSL